MIPPVRSISILSGFSLAEVDPISPCDLFAVKGDGFQAVTRIVADDYFGYVVSAATPFLLAMRFAGLVVDILSLSGLVVRTTAAPSAPSLSGLAVILARLLPEADIVCSLRPDDALSLVHTHRFAAVFIDSNMDISDRIHEASPDTQITIIPQHLSPEEISRLLPKEHKRL